MFPRVLRAAVFLVATIAIWTVSRPALAMPAPYCDDRGATAVAPPPTLGAPELGLKRARVAAPCATAAAEVGAAVAPGHAPSVEPAPTSDPAVPLAAACLPARARGLRLPVAGDDPPASDGARSRVDRPPRG